MSLFKGRKARLEVVGMLRPGATDGEPQEAAAEAADPPPAAVPPPPAGPEHRPAPPAGDPGNPAGDPPVSGVKRRTRRPSAKPEPTETPATAAAEVSDYRPPHLRNRG